MTKRNRSEKTLSKLRYEMVFWDWKDQPDWPEIQKSLVKGFIYLSWPDTGSNQYVLLMTEEKLTQVEGDRLYTCFIHELERE